MARTILAIFGVLGLTLGVGYVYLNFIRTELRESEAGVRKALSDAEVFEKLSALIRRQDELRSKARSTIVDLEVEADLLRSDVKNLLQKQSNKSGTREELMTAMLTAGYDPNAADEVNDKKAPLLFRGVTIKLSEAARDCDKLKIDLDAMKERIEAKINRAKELERSALDLRQSETRITTRIDKLKRDVADIKEGLETARVRRELAELESELAGATEGESNDLIREAQRRLRTENARTRDAEKQRVYEAPPAASTKVADAKEWEDLRKKLAAPKAP